MDETFGELLGQFLYKELRSGAYMGFFAFAGVIIGLTLIGYYVTSRGVSGWLVWLLCGLPLFFGYVAARRIPADRHYLYDGG